MPNSAKAAPDVKDVEDQIKAIRDDVAELTSLLRDLAGAKASEAGRTLQGEADEILRRTREAAEGVSQKAKGAASSLEDHIVEKPVQSALIALLIGLVIGILGRR